MYVYKHSGDQVLPDETEKRKRISLQSQHYTMCNGILYHIYERRGRKLPKESKLIKQVVLPKCLRKDVLLAYHDSKVGGGHLGTDKVYEALRLKYYWSKMHQDIEDYIISCRTCQEIKKRHVSKPPLTNMPVVDTFQRWHMDILGPLPESKEGYKYILLVVDSFSRWSEAFCLRTMEACEVATKFYEEIICRYGAPRSLLTDRGRNFMSKVVKALCEIFEVKQYHTSSFHPQTNSTCERLNSTLEQSLRAYCSKEQSKWPSFVPGIMMAFRRSPCTRSTDFSPFHLVFGSEMNMPFDVNVVPKNNMSNDAKSHVKDLIHKLKVSKEIAKENVKKSQENSKTYYDKKAKTPDFKVRDRVWLDIRGAKKGVCPKLYEQWQGPYYIAEIGPNYTYRIVNIETDREHNSFVNAARLTKFLNTAGHRDRIQPPDPPVVPASQDDNTQSQENGQLDDPSQHNDEVIPDTQLPGENEHELVQDTQNNEAEIVQDPPVNPDPPSQVDRTSQSQKDEDEDDEDVLYEFQRILKKRRLSNGKSEYLILWKSKERTWEPEENIDQEHKENFHIKYTNIGRARKRKVLRTLPLKESLIEFIGF